MENLGINSKLIPEESVSNDSVNYIIRKFQNHPNITKLKENRHGHFSFSAVKLEDF